MNASSRTHSKLPAWPFRLAALACLFVIGTLTWLAADPIAHAWVDRQQAPLSEPLSPTGIPLDDSGCVIHSFIIGATDLFALFLACVIAVLSAKEARFPRAESHRPVSGYYEHAHCCGPPLR